MDIKSKTPAFTICDDMETEDVETLTYDYNIALNENIICIADLGLWNGRKMGYKILRPNLESIFEVPYLTSLYVNKRGNVRVTGNYHDGTNYYLFREWKDNLSDSQKETFLNKVYYEKVTSQDISRYTKSLGELILGCNYRVA